MTRPIVITDSQMWFEPKIGWYVFLLQSKPKKNQDIIYIRNTTNILANGLLWTWRHRHGTNDHSFLKLDYISADSRSLDHQMAAYSSATITNPFDDDADRNDLFLPCLRDAIFATRPIPPTTLTFFLKNKSEKFPPNCICWCYHGVDYWRILLGKWVIQKDDLANLSKLLLFCHLNPLTWVE